MHVVGVLVGDEHRVGPVERLRLAEVAGVDDDDPSVAVDPYARVTELGDPHGTQTRPAECLTNRTSRGAQG